MVPLNNKALFSQGSYSADSGMENVNVPVVTTDHLQYRRGTGGSQPLIYLNAPSALTAAGGAVSLSAPRCTEPHLSKYLPRK